MESQPAKNIMFDSPEEVKSTGYYICMYMYLDIHVTRNSSRELSNNKTHFKFYHVHV